MTITQTVDIPDSRRITLEVPREIPTGKANIIIFPVREAEPQTHRTRSTLPKRDKGELRLEGDFSQPLKQRVCGCLKGQIWMADDFDEPLEDFKDYM